MNSLLRAGGLRGYESLMQGLGTDPRPLLERHGLSSEMLADPETLVSLNAALMLLEESAGVTNCPDFGLRLSQSQDPTDLGLLAVVIQNSGTIAQAIADSSRYLFLHSPAFKITMIEKSPLLPGSSSLRFDMHLPLNIPQAQGLEQSIGRIFRMAQAFANRNIRIRGVSFPHAPISEKRVYRRYFGVPVYFSQAFAGIHAEHSELQAELKSSNSVIHRLALDYIDKNIAPVASGLSERVRQTLLLTMGTGKGTKAEIASILKMHPRTLQRHLHGEGENFEIIREDVYKAAALRFLRDSDLPLKQIASLLGFSEHSSLTRACNRWFSASPAQIRASK